MLLITELVCCGICSFPGCSPRLFLSFPREGPSAGSGMGMQVWRGGQVSSLTRKKTKGHIESPYSNNTHKLATKDPPPRKRKSRHDHSKSLSSIKSQLSLSLSGPLAEREGCKEGRLQGRNAQGTSPETPRPSFAEGIAIYAV